MEFDLTSVATRLDAAKRTYRLFALVPGVLLSAGIALFSLVVFRDLERGQLAALDLVLFLLFLGAGIVMLPKAAIGLQVNSASARRVLLTGRGIELYYPGNRIVMLDWDDPHFFLEYWDRADQVPPAPADSVQFMLRARSVDSALTREAYQSLGNELIARGLAIESERFRAWWAPLATGSVIHRVRALPRST